MHRAVGTAARVGRGAVRNGRQASQKMSTLALSPHSLLGEGVDREGFKAPERASHAEYRTKDLKSSWSSSYFTTRNAVFANHSASPHDIVQLFRQAMGKGDLLGLHQTYRLLREEAIELQQASHATSHRIAQGIASITVEDLRMAMKLAAGPPSSFVPLSSKTEKERVEDKLQRRSDSDGRLVQQLFHDIKEVFGFAIEDFDCSLALSALALKRTSPKEAIDYFKMLCSNFGFSWTSNDAEIIMGLCSRNADVSVAHEVWAMIKDAKVRISGRVQDYYLHVLLKSGNVATARDVAFNKRGLDIRGHSQRDLFSYAWFLEGASRAGIAKYRQLRTIAKSLLEHLSMPGRSSTPFEWHALAIYTSLVHDAASARKLLRTARSDGHFEPTSKTFNILLLCHKEELERIASTGSEMDAVELLASIQEDIGVVPDRRSYSIGISSLLGKPLDIFYKGIKAQERHLLARSDDFDLRDIISDEVMKQPREIEHKRESISIPRSTPGQVYEAQLLYQRFRNTGQYPDNAMVDPLIRALTSSYLPDLTKAMQLYDDLRIFHEKGSNDRVTREIYDMLLKACADARDAPTAARLIDDMVNDGMTISPSNAANFATLLIPASTSYDAAFRIYEHIRDASANINQNGSDRSNSKLQVPFDRKGWIHIINLFSKLKFAHEESSPVGMLLSMISDMSKCGLQPDARLFTTLFRFYGYQASDPNSDLNDLQFAVIELHSYFQRENIQPDLTLVTALMDAYNRVGLTRQALEIWHRLVLNKTHLDSVCIAVALDTCGHSTKLAEVRKVWKWVRRNADQAKECNKAVWDAYLEALARRGELEEAIDIAFGEMRIEVENRNDDSQVDAKTMGMLLKFASGKRHWWMFNVDEEYPLRSKLQEKMQKELPHIWEQLRGGHLERQS